MALEFELHLASPRDLFVFRPEAYDPFDPDALGESGIEYIVAHTRAGWISVPAIRATVYLPPGEHDAGLEDRVRAALRRHCAAQLAANRRGRAALFANNLVFLAIAIVIVLIGLALQARIATASVPGGKEVRDALSTGIDVLIWVAMWTPVSAYVLDWYPFFQERRIYRALMDMELSVKAKGAR